MTEILMMILKIIVMIFVPAITSILTFYFKKYVNLAIDKHFANQQANELKQAVDIIADSVNYVQQTYVSTLKQQDKFDVEAQKEAFRAAKERALELMNDSILQTITDNYGSIDTYISTLIESMVSKS